MSVVTGGLGLPEEGALVAQGLGLSELDLNAMTAHLAGSGSLTATLTATGEEPTEPPVTGGPIFEYRPVRPEPVKRRVRYITANLHGSSTLTATGEAVDRWQPSDDFNYNLEILLELV